MENSSSYLALEGMLQQGWVFMSLNEPCVCLRKKGSSPPYKQEKE